MASGDHREIVPTYRDDTCSATFCCSNILPTEAAVRTGVASAAKLNCNLVSEERVDHCRDSGVSSPLVRQMGSCPKESNLVEYIFFHRTQQRVCVHFREHRHSFVQQESGFNTANAY